MSVAGIEAERGSHPTQEAIAKRIADAVREQLPDRARQGADVEWGVFEPRQSIKIGVFDRATDEPLTEIHVSWKEAEARAGEIAALLAAKATEAWDRRER